MLITFRHFTMHMKCYVVFATALKPCIFIVDRVAEVLSMAIIDRPTALCLIQHLFVEIYIYVYIG